MSARYGTYPRPKSRKGSAKLQSRYNKMCGPVRIIKAADKT